MIWLQVAGIAVPTVPAIIAAFLVWWGAREKNDADATKVIKDTAVELINPLREQMDELREENAGLRRDLNRAFNRIGKLERQIREAGMEPVNGG